MKILTEYALAFVDYVKAEAAAARGKLVKTVVGLGVLAVALCLMATAFGLLFAALLVYLGGAWGWPVATLVTGGILLVFAIIVAEIGLWLAK